MLISLAHLVEHLVQSVQFYVLGWERGVSRGFLGLIWPWLVQTEYLHYLYALVMLVGIWVLLPGFTHRAPVPAVSWTAAWLLQGWHHVEHANLLTQYLIGSNWWNAPKPLSFLEMLIGSGRIEVHLGYTLVVLIPMLVALLRYDDSVEEWVRA
jgi:hypothetical protein